MHIPIRLPFSSILAATFVISGAGFAELPQAPSTLSNLGSGLAAVGGPNQSSVAKELSLAHNYLTGHGVAQDMHLAAEAFERAAKAGDAGAQNTIGYFYQAGIGVQQDTERAFHWYQLSAANGSTNGKVNLAVAYVWGTGVRRDAKLGESLLKEASQKGSGMAAAYLGDMYISGIGIAPDREKAMDAYERGARLHCYYAEYKLGIALSQPNEHPQNLERSIALLRKSASDGYVPAMYLLGLIAVNHPDSNVPHEEALMLLRNASDAGSWKASTILGVLARDGKWEPQSNEEAYRYFERAALDNEDVAAPMVQRDLESLARKLDSGNRERLDNEAREWKSKHPLPLQMIYKKGQKFAPAGAYALSSPDPGQHVGILVSPVPD